MRDPNEQSLPAHTPGSDETPGPSGSPDSAGRPGAGRRGFLLSAGTGLAAAVAARGAAAAGAGTSESGRVTLAPIQNPQTEAKESTPDPSVPPDERVGYAIVGLGRLALDEILPAFGASKYSRPVALVSSDRDKALKVARQYGIAPASIYDYRSFDRIADNPDVKVVYIVLPNSMHAEFTVRAAKAGKHVLCEKPMATSIAECTRMIDACRRADRRLMIAYRSQYEPRDRALAKWVREKRLGELRQFVAVNSQNVGDPDQWRLKRSLAGGGALPDIGLYCLNAARFLSGEEPDEVLANVVQPKGDPRFTEVEQSVQFILRFPSGFAATCASSYASHESRYFRIEGANGWAEMNPAFSYHGLRLRRGQMVEGRNTETDISFPPAMQFAREIDHMSMCVMRNQVPHTPGEEGLQDQRIMEAIYESARTGRAVALSAVAPTRGPEPDEESF
jgi:predicted dehydrogenase